MNSKLDKNTELTSEEEYEGVSSKKLVLAVVVISIIGFALLIGFQQNPGEGVIAAKQEGNNLVIELDDITYEASFYYYKTNNVKIKFFAILGADNQPHIAFDACDACYAAKMGYVHFDPYMKCLNCGNTYLVSSLGTENLTGGCWPSYLPFTIADGKIVINKSVVTQKLFMFT